MAGNVNQVWARHTIAGGWQPDLSPSVEASLDRDGRIIIPHLTDAKNCVFGPPGTIQELRKIFGLAKLNSSALESGSTIAGMFDYWRFAGSLSGTQRRVVLVGTTIKADAADGTFSDIRTGRAAAAIPAFAVMNDELVIATDGDVPQLYDGTTCANLGGSPPNFSFCVQHKNRMWAAGVAAAGSTLYYSVGDDHEDWAGAGSGSILVDSADGDRITGLASHKDRLFVFKGPNRGSIYMITGSTPTGTDAFAKVPFVYGVGAACHQAIFPFGNDIGFMTGHGAVHSLKATDAYGSFSLASLSNGLDEYLSANLNFNRIKFVQAISDQLNSRVYFTISVNANATHNRVLVMDYRFNPVRWTYADWKAAASLAIVKDTGNNGRPVVMFGGYDGFVRKPTTSSSVDGSTAISVKVTTPFLHYGFPQKMKTMNGGAVTIIPLNSGNFEARWFRDNNAYQSETVAQGGGAVLDTFVLDTDVLGGGRSSDRFFRAETGGEARSIAWELYQATLDQDFRITGWLADLTVGADSYESV